MVVGTTLLRFAGAAFYSPIFFRGGVCGSFSVHLLQIAGATSLSVTLQHKNSDEAASAFVDAGSFPSATTAGTVYTYDSGTLKEQLRLKFVVNGSAASDAVHFDVLAPVWRDF